MAYEREKEVAVEAVRLASRLCRAVRETLVSAESLDKRDRSPVTVADFGGQAVVSMALAAAFPHDPMIGEEDAAQLRAPEGEEIRARVVAAVRTVAPDASEAEILEAIDRGTHAGGPQGRFWTLDPIDGTKGFLRNEQYAVALALLEEGEVVLGVLGCPNLSASGSEGSVGCLFVAVRGEGTFSQPLEGGNWSPVHADRIADPSLARFCESVESAHSAQGDASRVAELLGVTAPPLRMDSQVKYAVVGRGEASIYLRLPTRADYEERIWDHAAGWIVIREAGGEVTDMHGAPLDFSAGRTLRHNRGVIATNGILHDRVIDAIRRLVAP